MENFSQPTRLRTVEAARLAGSAVAVVAALAAATAAFAGGGNTTSHYAANKAPRHHARAAFKKPKLHRGLLTVEGTDAADKIALRLQAGYPNILQIDAGDDGSADFSFDRNRVRAIVVSARAGDDSVRIDESNGAFTNVIPTFIAGGDGNDRIAGGAGAETLLGGDGDDTIDGNGGNDRSALGAGDDTFVWDPGDGSDTIEGEAGNDTMLFNGAAADEQVTLSANGSRLKFFRVQANITMDTAGVETVEFNALGGADLVTVNDLSGTDVTAVNVDLAGTPGGSAGDGQPDRVVVNATDGNDSVHVNGDAGGVKVSGLAAGTELLHPDAADRLEVNTLAGTDTVDSSGLAPGTVELFVNGHLRP
jgi:Ca2+-binding RTX toxin-like protein